MTFINNLNIKNIFQFEDWQLGVIRVHGDGSCFFHSYCLGLDGDNYLNKNYFVNFDRIKTLRRNIANDLSMEICQQLGRGEFMSTMKEVILADNQNMNVPTNQLENVTLDYLRNTLKNPRKCVGIEHMEYLSKRLKFDPYFLTPEHKKYEIGDAQEVLRNKQISIIFLYSELKSHFDLIVRIGKNGQIQSCFGSNDPLILFLKKSEQN